MLILSIMDKERMIFEIDRRTVTEGDIVEINWRCPEAEQVKLTINNGFRSNEIQLEQSGTKRFRLNRSKGKTQLRITVMLQGKEHHKDIYVKVKKMPTVKAETVDSNGRKVNFLMRWWQQALTKWHATKASIDFRLRGLSVKKQFAVKLLAAIAVMLIISFFWPKFYTVALSTIAIILIVVLLRKD